MADLGLRIHVEKHFDFLVSEYGYERTVANPYLIKFESCTTAIELAFDGNRSYELELLVGRVGEDDPPFSIGEILRLRHASEAQQFSLVQVTSIEAMASFIAQLAQILRTHGSDFIVGNQQSFSEIKEQRQKEVKTYAFERHLRKARTEAEVAWQKKDYVAVAKALKPFRAALTVTEIGKLEFAETNR